MLTLVKSLNGAPGADSVALPEEEETKKNKHIQ